MQPNYEEFDENEKFAMEVAILNESPKVVGPTRFPDMAESTYYKYKSNGRDKLVRRGILDSRFRPTDAAFEILPYPAARNLIQRLYKKMMEFRDNWVKAEEARISQIAIVHEQAQHVESLKQELERSES